MQVGHVARRAVRRLGLTAAAGSLAPGLRRVGVFDGLTGVAFTGWIANGVEPRITMVFGGEALASVTANLPRPDVVQAGVSGAKGFAFPLSMLEATMKKRFAAADKEPTNA